MKYELTIYELGTLLKNINSKYTMNMLLRNKVSGGFITITGIASIEYTPNDNKLLKGNNIIGLKIANNESDGIDFKITSINNSKFNIDISPTKYKEINLSGLSINKLKERTDECKLKIDEDLIFTIPSSSDIVEAMLNNN